MRTFSKRRRTVLLAVMLMMLAAVQALSADSKFSISGDLSIEVEEAEANLVKIRRKIPALNVISTPAMIKKLGKTYSVNLFLPDGFQASPGSYPISTSYRGKTDVLGASLVAAGKVHSHDVEGQAEFADEDEQIRVVFSFRAANADAGKPDRVVVTVTGEAVFDRTGLASLY